MLAIIYTLSLRITVHVCLQDALLAMDASALSVEQLDALSRAVPDDSERRDIRQYLKVWRTQSTAGCICAWVL